MREADRLRNLSADELEAEVDELRRHANERRDMVEMPEGMSMRTAHQLAQEGCRFFYLRPKEGGG